MFLHTWWTHRFAVPLINHCLPHSLDTDGAAHGERVQYVLMCDIRSGAPCSSSNDSSPAICALRTQDSADSDARALRRIFRSLKDSVMDPNGSLGAGRPHELDGVFRRLMNPEEFRRMVMPGLSSEELLVAPSTFQVSCLGSATCRKACLLLYGVEMSKYILSGIHFVCFFRCC